MLTFREFLTRKFSEVNLPPDKVNQAIGNIVGARATSPADVGKAMADASIQTAVGAAMAPKTQQAMAIANQRKNKLQPQQPNINNLLPANMGTMMAPGTT
jgi:hypothetical protein